jgi:NADPH-dependent 2,4-dienoyl-CoA reductase/sulfur reductase-like enzyme
MTRAQSTDILVIGAGPAGIAAACAAAQNGRRVTLIDDNANPGGQIWRGHPQKNRQADRWLARLHHTNCQRLFQTTIVGAPAAGFLLAEDPLGPLELRYDRLILATGARERFLPFPGWTSPRIFGAGGLQAMVKSGMPIAGKSVLLAGSGPLLLAVAAALRKQGSRILFIAEQTPRARVGSFARRLLLDSPRLSQAIALKTRLIGVPYRTDCWPTQAIDDGASLRVTLHTPAGPREIECDYLACGYFLVPIIELPALLECPLNTQGVTVDSWLETLTNLFAAGESTGIGGLDKSLLEGEIAGHAAAGNRDAAARLFPARDKAHRFAAALRSAFELRDELKRLPQPDTLVCRCEDVPYGSLTPHRSMRDAKLQTRCGMGPCQGRICGPSCEFFFNWRDTSIRPPIFPTALANLSAAAHSP